MNLTMLLLRLLCASAEPSIMAAQTNTVAGGARPGEETPILRAVLDPMKVVRVAVAVDRVTTLRFPSAIAAMDSFQVGTDPEAGPSFLLNFHAGEAFFSVRALREGAATSLNVIWDRRTFVIELVHSTSPNLSVIFEAAADPKTRGSSAALLPSRLLAKLDLAKAYSLLRQQHPSAVAGVEVARPNTTLNFLGYSVTIEEVFRFDAEDVLVFRILLKNRIFRPLEYDPASIMVRVGARVYYQAITDAAGVVPPAQEVPVYFAICGSADGSRAELSLKNEFTVLLARSPFVIGPPVSPPIATNQPNWYLEGTPTPPIGFRPPMLLNSP